MSPFITEVGLTSIIIKPPHINSSFLLFPLKLCQVIEYIFWKYASSRSPVEKWEILDQKCISPGLLIAENDLCGGSVQGRASIHNGEDFSAEE